MQHDTPLHKRLALGSALFMGATLSATPALAAPFYFIDPVTPYGVIVNDIYQMMMWLGLFILVVVEVSLAYALIKFRKKPGEVREPATWSHNTTLELVWTAIPFLMLVAILFPTYKGVSYLANIPKTPDLILEVVGRQFFWEYRFPELNATFTSSMRTEQSSKILPGQPEWDPLALYLPTDRKILVKITGADVIHSWWVPAFGFQQMTTPGNLVQIPLEITKAGNYTGACAYLCGPYHGAMDIKVKAVEGSVFDGWIATHKATGPIDPIAKVGKIGMVAAAPQKPGHGAGHDATTTTIPVTPVDPKALMAQGQTIFSSKCAGCHQAMGTGVPNVFPPLAGAEQVNGPEDELIDILLHGKSGPITVKGAQYNSAMPPFGSMSDEEVAAVATYVRGSFGNQAKPILPEQVKAKR